MRSDAQALCDHFLAPRNAGAMIDASATGSAASLVCGAVVRVFLRVDATAARITEARFQAVGCSLLIAAASVITEAVREVSIEEAARLSVDTVSEQLNASPSHTRHCITLVHDALRAAMSALPCEAMRVTKRHALVCTCFSVAESEIEAVIDREALLTVEQVTMACGAGGGCGSCQPLIQDRLESYWNAESNA